MMYYADHDPPHFHVRSPDFRAKVALADLTLIEVTGRARPAQLNNLRDWARRHQVELFDNWLRAQRLQPLVKIED